jgi:hypothetical protein
MEESPIEIETHIDYYRKKLSDSGKLGEAKRCLVQAQNHLQKYIEINFHPSEWRHKKLAVTNKPIFSETSEETE